MFQGVIILVRRSPNIVMPSRRRTSRLVSIIYCRSYPYIAKELSIYSKLASISSSSSSY